MPATSASSRGGVPKDNLMLTGARGASIENDGRDQAKNTQATHKLADGTGARQRGSLSWRSRGVRQERLFGVQPTVPFRR